MAWRPALLLVYHGLGDLDAEDDPDRLFVPAERFSRQIDGLRRRGYEFVTVASFAKRLREGAPIEALCAVTFDDGGADNAELLPDLIETLRIPVTLYVCPELLGEPHPFVSQRSGRRLMDAAQLRAIAGRPQFEIGSHTRNHRDLSKVADHDAHEEMTASKAALEAVIDTEVLSFAYPFCGYSAACPAAARRAGYTSAVTCGPRGGRAPYELRRDMVGAHDGRVRFELKARGAAHAARRPKRWLARRQPGRSSERRLDWPRKL